MNKKVIVLHEYGDKRHFIALERLKEEGILEEIEYLEFSILKELGKGILRRNKNEMDKFKKNIARLPKLFFEKNQTIVLGAAPFDIRMTLLEKLKKNNKIIYFTSWPYWDYSFYPKKIHFTFQKKHWKRFLNNTMVASVTKKCRETLNEYNIKYNHVPHSIDLSVYDPSIREAAGNRKDINVLFVGRLEDYKGILLIIDIIKQQLWKNVNFIFIGKGPLEHQIEQLSKEYSNVKYLGFVQGDREKAELYSQCDILLLPSIKTEGWEELFGIAIIEAMAMGLPVISTDCVGPQEIVTDETDGFIIEQNNLEQLKEKLNLLITDEQLRKKMSINAVEKAKQYDINVIKEKWHDILDRL